MPTPIEKETGKNRVLSYTSHFDEFATEVVLVEDFEGNARLAINKLKESLQTGNESVHMNIFLFSLIAKATIEQKVKLWEGRNNNYGSEKVEAAIEAISLCIDLSDPIYHAQSEDALAALQKYESFIVSNELEEIFNMDVTEKEADRRIMPVWAGEEDLRKAENLATKTGNAPILAIIMAHRGIRRGFDFFYDYVSKTGNPESKAWLVRCKDRFPKLTESEEEFLRRESKGREIVVIGPPEIFYIFRDGEKKPINRLSLAKNCFSKIVFGTTRNPAKVIPIPISFKR
ncbi:MAG: hypothetical protein A2W22_01080 [Candidatus Levybacteria bacterium RBG_16_35_11]|nr:MAG: hypothetical protein A2W22_01080 [Candidatus Levybacteria bacterium RBG_16_35_11]